MSLERDEWFDTLESWDSLTNFGGHPRPLKFPTI